MTHQFFSCITAQSDSLTTVDQLPTPQTTADLITSQTLPPLIQSAPLPALGPNQESVTPALEVTTTSESHGQQSDQSPAGYVPSLLSNPSFPSLPAPLSLNQLVHSLPYPWTALFPSKPAKADRESESTTSRPGFPSFPDFPTLPPRPSFTGTPPPLSQFLQGLLGLAGARNPQHDDVED